MNPFWADDVTQDVLAEVDQLDVGRKVVGDQGRRCGGQQHLSTGAERPQACRAVDRTPVVVTVAHLHLTGVDASADT